MQPNDEHGLDAQATKKFFGASCYNTQALRNGDEARAHGLPHSFRDQGQKEGLPHQGGEGYRHIAGNTVKLAGFWSADEHGRFEEGLAIHGRKEMGLIALHVGTRDAIQCRTHAQKFFLKQAADMAAQGIEPAPEPEAETSMEKWAAEEEVRFVEAVQFHGRKDMALIARHVRTRDAVQCNIRAQNLCLNAGEAAEKSAGRWTADEHRRFEEATAIHGRDWALVAFHVGTRNGRQCWSHAQKKTFSKASDPIEADSSPSKMSAAKPWTADERERFEEAIEIHGRKWPLVAKHVGTRNRGQCWSHARNIIVKAGSVKGEQAGLRRGKWTPAEEEFSLCIIRNFERGLLPIEPGTSLRSYLADRLKWCEL